MNKIGLEVISIPVKMKKQIQKVAQIKEIRDRKKIIKKIREGNLSKPIITCKNTLRNFYYGQTYEKFSKVPLASEHWSSKKVKGDYFMIHNYSENPAFFTGEISPSFEDLGLDKRVVNQLIKSGHETPTNIQTLAIPEVLQGYNTIISAETGNGKTLSFLAPILHQILHSNDENVGSETLLNCPKALILLPSRELVAQTRDVARKLRGDLDIQINSIIGGFTKGIMLHPKVMKTDILIGSFGALSKLFNSGVYKTHRLKHVVLDEADTLLDDSFNKKMIHLLKKFTINNVSTDEVVGAQLTLVGATFPTNLNNILKEIINVDSVKQIQTPYLHRLSPHVTHTFLKVKSSGRLEALMRVSKKNQRSKIPTIIFCNKSSCSNFVANFLNENEIPCVNINGDMESYERKVEFERFQNGEVDFIACTDLISRGLDTVRTKHVVNFDFPQFMSDYIHRCGRTGRVGSENDCHVTSFIFSSSDAELVQKIEYAARKIEELPKMNANIKRALLGRAEKRMQREIEEMEAKEDAKIMEQEIKQFDTSHKSQNF